MSKQDNYRFEEDVIEKKKFLSTKFNKNLENEIGYQQYNFDSSWIFQFQMDQRMIMQYDHALGESVLVQAPGYKIKRHKKFGEVPDFKWYRFNFPNEYSYQDKS